MTTPSSTQPYKLRRARKGRMLAGVAAGLATASGLDVTIVRICMGVSMLTGLGIIGYLLLWIAIPEEQPSRGDYVEPAPESTARVIRFVLLGGALLVLLQKLGIFWPFETRGGHTTFGFDGVLALILLSLGVGVLVSRHRSDGWTSPSTTATEPASWTAPVTTPSADDLFEDDDADAVSFVGPLRDVAHTVRRDVTDALADARTDPMRVKKVGGGAALGWARVAGWLVLLWWVAGALVTLGLWRFGALIIKAPAILFIASWVVFTLVINALIRVRKPAVVLATLLSLLVPIAIAQGTVSTDGPAGTRTMRPLTASPVSNYRQSVGKLELDLSATRFPGERTSVVNARVGAGALVITVPDNVSVTVITRSGAGAYDVMGKRTEGGLGTRETLRFDGCAGAPHLLLRLRSGVGWMEVRRANGADVATCAAPVTPGAPVTPTTAVPG